MAKNSTGTSTDVMPVPGASEIHPKGLLDAISYIDQNFANELGGCIISGRFLSTKQRLEFMEVGFRSSFISGLISVFLTPIAIGVLEKYIPMFGNPNPGFMDQMSALMLALSFYIGYAGFIAKSSTCYIGEYTKAMVNNLLGGMTFGAVLKAIVAYIAFQALYFNILTPKNLSWVVYALQKTKVGRDTGIKAYYWIMGFKDVFLTSANLVLITTILFTLIPWVAYWLVKIRNRRWIKAGIVKLEARAY